MRADPGPSLELRSEWVELAVGRQVPDPLLVGNHLARLEPVETLFLDGGGEKALYFATLRQHLCPLPREDLDAEGLAHFVEDATNHTDGDAVKTLVRHVSAIGRLVVRG